MNTWPTYNPFSVTNCLHCGDAIEQPKHGGRPRQYCNKPACRKAGSRTKQRDAAERVELEQREHLRLLWQRLYDPTTITIMEELLASYGSDAATLATEALNLERNALHRLIAAQRRVREAEHKKRGEE